MAAVITGGPDCSPWSTVTAGSTAAAAAGGAPCSAGAAFTSDVVTAVDAPRAGPTPWLLVTSEAGWESIAGTVFEPPSRVDGVAAAGR
ncbi:MAG: hypothetical protein KDB50_00875 [Mycobacterium sp.]|nr:hypothetical protein [Mycobacterium sp.]